jgi:hypothetical protein
VGEGTKLIKSFFSFFGLCFYWENDFDLFYFLFSPF